MPLPEKCIQPFSAFLVCVFISIKKQRYLTLLQPDMLSSNSLEFNAIDTAFGMH